MLLPRRFVASFTPAPIDSIGCGQQTISMLPCKQPLASPLARRLGPLRRTDCIAPVDHIPGRECVGLGRFGLSHAAEGNSPIGRVQELFIQLTRRSTSFTFPVVSKDPRTKAGKKLVAEAATDGHSTVAAILGVSESHLYRLISGDRVPGWAVVNKANLAYGISIADWADPKRLSRSERRRSG
jgi:transcriptional regulator with XRE-family HTH domain